MVGEGGVEEAELADAGVGAEGEGSVALPGEEVGLEKAKASEDRLWMHVTLLAYFVEMFEENMYMSKRDSCSERERESVWRGEEGARLTRSTTCGIT